MKINQYLHTTYYTKSKITILLKIFYELLVDIPQKFINYTHIKVYKMRILT